VKAFVEHPADCFSFAGMKVTGSKLQENESFGGTFNWEGQQYKVLLRDQNVKFTLASV
jgi:hypothetical protein